jgi:hypothetical protein
MEKTDDFQQIKILHEDNEIFAQKLNNPSDRALF